MLKADNLEKVFVEGGNPLCVLKGISLEIPAGKKTVVFGASGSGKSTLLHILAGLEEPTKGSVLLGGADLYALSETKRAAVRNRTFGFVFQFYHLLSELNALENVMLPALIAGVSSGEAKRMAGVALERVGLKERAGHLPSRLSGGEQQRVALARSVVLKPKILFADEPTGNLDPKMGETILEYMEEVLEEGNGSLLMVTHNPDLVKNRDRVLKLEDGQLHEI